MMNALTLLHMLDMSAVHYFYSIRAAPLITISIAVSEIAAWYTVSGVAIVTALYLFSFKDGYRNACSLGLLIATGGAGLAVAGLKELFMRARPDIFYQAYPESWYSFPSGHAAGAIALYGYLWYLAECEIEVPKITRIVVRLGVPILVVMIGSSRLYLDVHYLTDVLAGYLVGGIFLYVGITIARRKVTSSETKKH